MKKSVVVLFCMQAAVLLGCAGADRSTTASRAEDSPFPVLDSYGDWIEVPTLGNVWHPRVGYDWRPFSEGQWQWTDRGWMWFSDEPYGWVVYHYGYWNYLSPAGWVWIPGYEWSPARVEWYNRENYVGWAPMPSPGTQLPEAYAPAGTNVWTIVPSGNFTKRTVGHYRGNYSSSGVPGDRSGDGHRPPDPVAIEQQTHEQINRVTIQTESVPVRGRQLMRVKPLGENSQPKSPPTPVIAPRAAPQANPAPVIAPVIRQPVIPVTPRDVAPKSGSPEVRPQDGTRGSGNQIAPSVSPSQRRIGQRARPPQKQIKPVEKDRQQEKGRSPVAPKVKSEKGKPPDQSGKIEKKDEAK